jgi:ABC-2 type transport system ATP-binding protein
MNAVEMVEVRRAYERGREVLRGVSLRVAPGEVVALLGRNGAGKTTLLRIAMGMLRSDGGRVSVLGLDPRREPVALKRRLGYVSEVQILPPELTVAGVLDLHRSLFPTWDLQLQHELQLRFRLLPSARIGALSKGEARQVALLCAVAHRPELLLLDEPAGGLDPAARREILETAVALLVESGTTIVFSSHHMADVERIAGRVVLLHEGLVRLDAELDVLRESYSLAVLVANGTGAEAIRALEGCIHVRRRGSAWHAVFSLPPEEVRARLGAAWEPVICRTVPLEELFVEMVEERS